MRILGLTSCFVLLLFAAACGGNVILDASSGGAPGGGGAVGVGAGGVGGGTVVVGAGGAVGVGGSGTVAVSATSVSSSGAGGSSPSCVGTYFQLVINGPDGNPMPVSLTSSCASSTPPVPVPFAFLTVGGPSSNPGTLTLEGCASPAPGSQGIVLTLPGAITSGTYAFETDGLTYTDANGTTTSNDLGGTLVISDFQPPGGTVVGELDAKVVIAGQGYGLQAKFAVCREPDVDVP